ncbi:MAG: hypothetical protein ACI8QS_001513 [Planctomycetota bacterium]|jgi:hypothetical protein
MNPEIGFPAFLVLTVVLLAGVAITGLKAKRKIHLRLVALALLSLAVTIFYAERLGKVFDLSTAGRITPIHLFIAKVTTLGYLAPLLTGFKTLRDPSWRKKHRICAFTIMGLTLLTAATGAMMIMGSERFPA